MAESRAKWIKISTNIFDDEKIMLIESMKEADTIICIWVKLLVMAGKSNNGGKFTMNGVPYTVEMLSAVLHRPLPVVKKAIDTFVQFGMIEMVDNIISITNWAKHQSLDAYEKKKERDREYQTIHRGKIAEKSSDCQTIISKKSSDKSSDKVTDKENKSSYVREKVEEKSSCVASLDKEREKEKEIDITFLCKGKEKEKESTDAESVNRLTIPTKQMVADRLAEIGKTGAIDIDHFLEYYNRQGWKRGGVELKWQSCLTSWLNREHEFSKKSDNIKPKSSFDTDKFFDAAIKSSMENKGE